ncbi:MAG: hypothetical protein KF703_08335 [Actinobacteria bacterium]|nr:hypothetical protein [Actinomycetota bacterium]
MRRAGTAGGWGRLGVVALVVLATAAGAGLPVAAEGDDVLGALRGGVWRALPGPPIPLRGDASAVWTGDELVVWGGRMGEEPAPYRGGRYDPSARTWSTTAAAPIAPRADGVVAWTGDEVLVWGGRRSDRSRAGATDGAAYDPFRDHWRTITRRSGPPRGARQQAGAWTGRELVVVSAVPASGGTTSVVWAHAYDPARDRWRTIGSHASGRHPDRLVRVDVVARGQRVDVWLSWEARPTGRGGVQERYRLNPGWRLAATAPGGQVTGLIAAGDRVAGLRGDQLCGPCSGGPLFASDPTLVLSGAGRDHRATGHDRWRALPRDDVVTDGGLLAWTGASIVRVSREARALGPTGERSRPGDAAAAELRTGIWIELPRAPQMGVGDVGLFWADDRLIMWGALGPTCTGREDVCPEGIALAGGIELAPPG